MKKASYVFLFAMGLSCVFQSVKGGTKCVIVEATPADLNLGPGRECSEAHMLYIPDGGLDSSRFQLWNAGM
jgi:hypothetical protein